MIKRRRKKSQKIHERMNNLNTASPAVLMLSLRTAENRDEEYSASRCGFPFRGFEEPVRDAGSSVVVGDLGAAARVLPVRWHSEVYWRKQIKAVNTELVSV